MVFLLKHLDYIYFFYGLSFMLLAGVCFLLDRNKNRLMPWSLLALFGIFRGLNEWISMMALSTGDFLFFDYMKISLLLMSFVFLFEFGRTGLRAIYPKFFGGLSVIWQYGALLIAVFALHSLGVDDFDTSLRYVFGFAGGTVSAVLLFHYYLSETKCRYCFLVSAICLFLYAMAAGLVANKGSFFLCQYLNTDNFQLYAGFPVQMLRAAIVITLTAALWEYCCFIRKVQYNALMDLSFGYGKWLTIAIIAVLCCGWILTMIISNSADRNQKEDLRITAEAIASGIRMENLKKLNGNLADLKTEEYRNIRVYLREFEGAAKDIRWFCLTRLKGGKIYFILDSSPENKSDFSPPGTVYADAPLELYGAFKDGKPVVFGPYSDKWGTFISAFIPIMDPETRKVDAVLGCDIDSVKWSQTISLSRLQPIIITLLICIILVISFLMHQSSLEASVIIYESEKKYSQLFNLYSHSEKEFSPQVQKKITAITEENAAAFLKLKITGELNEADNFNREVMEDLKRQKELQNRLAQSQKMESMGRLAGGIAHDFNNIIQVVNGFSELIMMQLDGNSEIREEIEEIGKAGKRAKDLTNQLILLSKRKTANITDVDVNGLISNFNNMRLCGPGGNIRLETVLAPDLNPAKADPNQLEQVLLNLAVNARDSMPDGGKLKIMTGNIHLEDKDLISINEAEAEAGDFVRISISDTGAGMTSEEKAHLFEPFFPIKGKGKGAGLGLSVVYGIVKQHNGWLNVCSEQGRGTTFEIHIPATANNKSA